MATDETPGRPGGGIEPGKRSRKWFLPLTAVLIALATISLSSSALLTTIAVALCGGLLIVTGILPVISRLGRDRWCTSLTELLTGLASTLAGLLVIANPQQTGITVILMLGPLLLIAGIGRTLVGLVRRRDPWFETYLNGVLTLLLGLLVWWEWGWLLTFLTLSFAGGTGSDSQPLGPGDYFRSLPVGEQSRSYLLHVPKGYDLNTPTPVVLALHGASMNGPLMAVFCGLNPKADKEGFLVVYPNGTGSGGFRYWDTSGLQNEPGRESEDVAFIRKVLDDLKAIVTVDRKRVYACGMSDGGMMCYRLAAKLSDRIAAIAPVAGSILTPVDGLQRPVPLIHFHGTADRIIPFEGMGFNQESIQTWAKLNGCAGKPKVIEELSKGGDDLTVLRKTYEPGREGAEVVLVVVEGGGHTWPGKKPLVRLLGKSVRSVSANDLIWDFFKNHPMKE